MSISCFSQLGKILFLETYVNISLLPIPTKSGLEISKNSCRFLTATCIHINITFNNYLFL
ncbi:MAG: hypothetical protein CLLPBCKN_000865 [Chroococcidiopsis cubana SAG 39.79]|nr:hypothetical protein [Chroococcidiopsis cubana SAG 39.79]